MDWEQIVHYINKFTDKPVVIAITSVLTILGSVLVFLSKTSFGKRAIKKLTELYELGHQRATETLEKVKDVETLANEKIEALKAEYEQKVVVVVSLFNFYVESLFALLELVPNAKVHAQLEQIKQEYQLKKQEITNVVGVIYQDYSIALEQKEDEIRKAYEGKIAYLESQIAQITLYLNEVKEEGNNGEGENTENTNPTEEEIQEN